MVEAVHGVRRDLAVAVTDHVERGLAFTARSDFLCGEFEQSTHSIFGCWAIGGRSWLHWAKQRLGKAHWPLAKSGPAVRFPLELETGMEDWSTVGELEGLREGSAKPLFVGSIPTRASNTPFQNNSQDTPHAG